jgi:hypothetical protein
MKPVKIFVTNWHRIEMLSRCLTEIRQRTSTPHEIVIFDNGSDKKERSAIMSMHYEGLCDSIILWPRNEGPYFPKAVFYSLTTIEDTYFVSNDCDTYPPLLSPDWLKQLLAEMDAWPDLGVIAPQIPPQYLQQPIEDRGNHVICNAVGNQLSLVRRCAWPVATWPQNGQVFGDDTLRSRRMLANGYRTAFSKDVWCLHAQPENWGYTEEEVKQDPRRAGYAPPYNYAYDHRTYMPIDTRLQQWRQP